MSTEKDNAIILRVIPFSETSCVVTLFTRNAGKISALAKGARRPKSPFESALDVLGVCRIVFIHKQSQTLDLLTEAKLERRFRAATRDLSRLYAGFYVVELLLEMTSESDPHTSLYDAAENAIRALDNDQEAAREVLRFELACLFLLGHLPSLDQCVDCGTEMQLKGFTAFGQLDGGLLCERCKIGKRQIVRVSPDSVRVLRQFADIENDNWKQMDFSPAILGELRGLISHYICHIIGHRPRMHEYLPTLLS